MSDKNGKIKLHFIEEMIDNIEFIINRHGDIVSAIEDIEGRMAILMGLSQIGETLNKLDHHLVEELCLLDDMKGAYYTRNYIVHDYEGVDPYVIEEVIRHHLPLLKEKIKGNRI